MEINIEDDTLIINAGQRVELTIKSIDKNGDIEVYMDIGEDNAHFYIPQSRLQLIIEFLTNQVTPINPLKP